jgi:RNA polymerase sigma-70 factor, ECF subfamily
VTAPGDSPSLTSSAPRRRDTPTRVSETTTEPEPKQAWSVASEEDRALYDRLVAGDEAALTDFVTRHHGALMRFVGSRRANGTRVDDVVQESWLAFIESLPRYEGRASLRTWLYRIVVNCMRSRARREGRSVPFSALVAEGDEPSVSEERFLAAGHQWEGHWATPLTPISRLAEDPAVLAETRRMIAAAIDALPELQRAVMTLRDVEGWEGEEICNALGISDTNQRVLLHRARSKVRSMLESQFEERARGARGSG